MSKYSASHANSVNPQLRVCFCKRCNTNWDYIAILIQLFPCAENPAQQRCSHQGRSFFRFFFWLLVLFLFFGGSFFNTSWRQRSYDFADSVADSSLYCHHSEEDRASSQYRNCYSRYGDFHYKNTTVMIPYFLCNGTSYTGNISLNWDGPLNLGELISNIYPTIIMHAVHPYLKWNKRSTEYTF